MVVHPNAKINLGLNIIAKRADGFHDIESCFLPIGLSDILEFNTSEDHTKITISGIDVPGKTKDNLCVKAWELLQKEFDLPFVDIRLKKIIPVGAGLGGGSSDAAYMLKALNINFKLGLSEDELMNYAARLGSDCSFFIKNIPTIASGKGEVLKPVQIHMKGFKIGLVNPGIHISTADAYAQVKPGKPAEAISKILTDEPSSWRNRLVNDFEISVFNKYPAIQDIKHKFYEFGAVYASMSGSGSSVYGIFKDNVPEKLVDIFNGSFIWYEN